MTNEKKSIMIDYSPSELAYGVFQNLSPLIEEKFRQILDEKDDKNAPPLSMAESADWLGVSRTTFSRLVAKGELKFKSLDPSNPKTKKYFLKSDLQDWLTQNQTKTINELKSSANGNS